MLSNEYKYFEGFSPWPIYPCSCLAIEISTMILVFPSCPIFCLHSGHYFQDLVFLFHEPNFFQQLYHFSPMLSGWGGGQSVRWAGGGKKFVSETVRCWKLILGSDIG